MIIVADSGKTVSNEDEHPSKTDSSIASFENFRLICDKDLLFLNSSFSIVVNEFSLQFYLILCNVDFLTDYVDNEIDTFIKDEQFLPLNNLRELKFWMS